MDIGAFAPLNLGQILANVENIKGAREDRAYRQQLLQDRQQDRAEDRQMRLEDRDRKQREAEIEEYGAAIAWADTPEKWDQAVDFLSRSKPDIARYRGQFQLRGQMAMELGALKQMLANQPKPDKDPALIQSLTAAGIDPRSPEGRQIVIDNLNPPAFTTFGSDATGRTMYQTRGTPRSAPVSGDPTATLTEIFGVPPNSGYRTQAHQDALRASGATQTRHSQHTARNALDFPLNGMTHDEAEARVRAQYPNARFDRGKGYLHVTIPGWGGAPDVSNSEGRYGGPRVVARTAPIAPKPGVPRYEYRMHNGKLQRRRIG